MLYAQISYVNIDGMNEYLLLFLDSMNLIYLASDKTPTTDPSAATSHDTILPLYNGRIALSSIISSLTTPKSSSLDLKKNLNL